MAVGVLEAWSAGVGGAINEVAGFRFTRLTANVAKGVTTFPVETTFGWPTTGRVVVNGITYSYTGKTNTTLTGIAWSDAGTPVTGAQALLLTATIAIDFSRVYSALDGLRAQMLVDTATAQHLSALGRNLGVTRPANLTDDAVFREVVKALSYLPKGTIYGLEIALTAFFGAGNFLIYEDFPTSPNTVFIKLLHGIRYATDPSGQAYFLKHALRPLNTGTQAVTLDAIPSRPPNSTAGNPVFVQGVRLADEDRSDVLTTTKPSALTEIRYPGDGGAAVWKFSGNSEADVTMASATGMQITNGGGHTTKYYRTLRIRPESTAKFSAFLFFAGFLNNAATSGNQVAMNIRDHDRDIAVGFIASGSQITCGFINTSTGMFIAGAAHTFNFLEWHDFEIRKNGTNAEFWVDGTFKQYLATSAFPASAINELRIGAQDATYSVNFYTKNLTFHSTTTTDYWNTSGNVAVLDTATPTLLDTDSGAIFNRFVGKAARTVGSDPAHPENSGSWIVNTVVDADAMTLIAPTRKGAVTSNALPTRITIANIPDAFHYPQDVNKKLRIITGPNAGTYVINAILDPQSGSPISGALSQASNLCTVTGAPAFMTGTNIDWQLLPNFHTETNVFWEVIGTGILSGLVLTLEQNPPLDIPGGYVVVMESIYATAHSAHILESDEVQNNPIGTWFPLYLPQPLLGPFGGFLSDLTVAGVIPEVLLA